MVPRTPCEGQAVGEEPLPPPKGESEHRDGCPTQVERGQALSLLGGALNSRLKSDPQLQKSFGLSAWSSLSVPAWKEPEPHFLPAQ